MSKRTYRTVSIQSVQFDALSAALGASSRCIVAVDVAKEAMVAGVADTRGSCAALIRFSHPTQTLLFVMLLTMLRELGRIVEVAMEPTGVYGDSLRYQLERSELPVYRVEGWKAHAMSSVLDGVPSQHDAKACTLIAHLHAQGLSKRWLDGTYVEQTLRSLVDERDLQSRPLMQCMGHLEATLARHYPELGAWVDAECGWHLQLLSQYPSPSSIASSPASVRELLWKASRGRLSRVRIEQVLTSASRTLGVPMRAAEEQRMQSLATDMLELRRKERLVDARIESVLSAHPSLGMMVSAFGPGTTAAIVGDTGDPASYSSSDAFEKALGLNLKERSSGKHQGQLRITKRGPSRARRYLFLAALRWIQRSPVVAEWYQRRRSHRGGVKLKAVIAVSRKLARSMPHVARGASFDAERLFDARKRSSRDAE